MMRSSDLATTIAGVRAAESLLTKQYKELADNGTALVHAMVALLHPAKTDLHHNTLNALSAAARSAPRLALALSSAGVVHAIGVLMSSPEVKNTETVLDAMLVLGELASSDSVTVQHRVLEQRALDVVRLVFDHWGPASSPHIYAAWVLSNLVRKTGRGDVARLRPLLHVLSRVLYFDSSQVLHELTPAVEAAARHSPAEVVASGVVPRLLQLAMEGAAAVAYFALHAITSIAETGDPRLTASVLLADGVRRLCFVVKSSHIRSSILAVDCLSSLLRGPNEYRDVVLSHDVWGALVAAWERRPRPYRPEASGDDMDSLSYEQLQDKLQHAALMAALSALADVSPAQAKEMERRKALPVLRTGLGSGVDSIVSAAVEAAEDLFSALAVPTGALPAETRAACRDLHIVERLQDISIAPERHRETTQLAERVCQLFFHGEEAMETDDDDDLDLVDDDDLDGGGPGAGPGAGRVVFQAQPSRQAVIDWGGTATAADLPAGSSPAGAAHAAAAVFSGFGRSGATDGRVRTMASGSVGYAPGAQFPATVLDWSGATTPPRQSRAVARAAAPHFAGTAPHTAMDTHTMRASGARPRATVPPPALDSDDDDDDDDL